MFCQGIVCGLLLVMMAKRKAPFLVIRLGAMFLVPCSVSGPVVGPCSWISNGIYLYFFHYSELYCQYLAFVNRKILQFVPDVVVCTLYKAKLYMVHAGHGA